MSAVVYAWGHGVGKACPEWKRHKQRCCDRQCMISSLSPRSLWKERYKVRLGPDQGQIHQRTCMS